MTAGDFARESVRVGVASSGEPLGVEGIPWPTADERSGASVLEAQPAKRRSHGGAGADGGPLVLSETAGARPLASRLAGPGRSSWEEGAAALGALFLGPCTRLNVLLTEDGPQTSWEAAGTAVGLRNYTRPPGPVSGHPAGPGGSVGRGGPGAEDAPERQGRPSLARPGLLAGGRVRTWAIEAPSGSKKRLRWRGPPEVLTRAGARSQPFHDDGGRGVPAEHAAGSLRLTGPGSHGVAMEVAMEVAWAAFSSETWGLSPAHVVLGRGQFPGTLGLRSLFSCRATWCPPEARSCFEHLSLQEGPLRSAGLP
nr:uncharacterized protein LOC112911490 [Vulpes vulpes]